MIVVLPAPSNLGLRPPSPGTSPGCSLAPDALLQAGLREALGGDHRALLAPGVQPAAYRDDALPADQRLRNQDALVDFSRRLARDLRPRLERGEAPLVLGGDCSITIGIAAALKARGTFAFVHIDGHTDFRHPGNSPVCLSAAGEDLAILVGRHWEAVADIDRLGPYVDPAHAVHVGHREDDEHIEEATGALGKVMSARTVVRDPAAAAEEVVAFVDGLEVDGFWVHLDVDVLDPEFMPAVDSPDPGGLSPEDLVVLLKALAPHAVGADVAIYDPTLDPDRRHARTLVAVVGDGLSELATAAADRLAPSRGRAEEWSLGDSNP